MTRRLSARPTSGARRAARAPRRRRRPSVRMAAVPHSTRPTVVGYVGRSRRGGARRAGRPGRGRPPTPAATGSPWGRPSRSCGRSAARGRAPRLGAPLGPAGTWRPARPSSRCAISSVAAAQVRARASLATQRSVGSSVDVGIPADSASASTSWRHAASTRSISARPAAARSMPRLGGDRRPQRRDRALGQPGDREHGVDERVVGRRLDRARAARLGSARPSARRGSRRRARTRSSKSSLVGGASSRSRSRWICARPAAPTPGRAAAGSLAGIHRRHSGRSVSRSCSSRARSS